MKPLVSCIMPTRNRPEMIGAAVDCFAAQTYPNCELLILEDGEPLCMKLLSDWVKRGIRVKYKFLGGPPRSIGTKRNILCDMARGELIAHFDDDDWSAPGRLESQVEALIRRPGAIATGFRTLKFWNPESRRAWLYCGSAQYAVGTSLVYSRAWWLGHPFEDVNVGEDGAFVDVSRGRMVFEFDQDRQVARIHSKNTADKLTGNEMFDEIEESELPAGFPKDL